MTSVKEGEAGPHYLGCVTSTSAIDRLSEEHGLLLGALAGLEELALRCMDKQPLDAERAAALVGLISEFGCGLHHAIEDELLFPLLEHHGVTRECGAIGVLTYEHEAFEEALSRLNTAMGEASEGDPWACRTWARQVDALSHISRGHMCKEEGVLFPFAQKALSGAEQEELFERMCELEEKRHRGLRERVVVQVPRHLKALGIAKIPPLERIGCPGDPRKCPKGGQHSTCSQGS